MDALRHRSARYPCLELVLAALLVSAPACGRPDGGDAGTDELSPFRTGSTITGRVLDNVTACEVDALCYLRLELADTVIDAVYGTGERPAPECEIPVEVSNAAFAAAADDVVGAVVVPCAGEGLFLRALER